MFFNIIALLISFGPPIFVFGFIFSIMYKTRKTNIRKSKSDIFGFIFLIFFALVFIGTIAAPAIDPKLSIVGFGILLFSILGLLFFGAVSSASTKNKEPDTITTNARLIDYTRTKSKKNADGYMVDYYTLRFVYNFGGGESKECVTLVEYTLSQIKYLQSLGADVKIEVCNKYCDLITRVNHIKDDSLRTTAPHPNKNLKTKSLYSVDLIAAIVCVLPITLGALGMAILAWQSSKFVSILIVVIAVIPTAMPIITTFKNFSTKMKIDKSGSHTTTRDFTITQLSNRRYTVEYTYLDNFGNTKFDKESIDADLYFAIQSLNGPLPIIVYEKDSIIDVNLINELRKTR